MKRAKASVIADEVDELKARLAHREACETAELEGMAAYSDGMGKDACPYESSSDYAQVWMIGYDSQMKESEATRQIAELERKLAIAEAAEEMSSKRTAATDFFTLFEAKKYIGRGVLLEANIYEGAAGETGTIMSYHLIGGAAYELRIVWDKRKDSELRINRTRLLRFFRLRQSLSDNE